MELSYNRYGKYIEVTHGAAIELKLSQPTIIYAIKNLIKLAIISELTGKQRDRIFVYDEYLKLLKQDT